MEHAPRHSGGPLLMEIEDSPPRNYSDGYQGNGSYEDKTSGTNPAPRRAFHSSRNDVTHSDMNESSEDVLGTASSPRTRYYAPFQPLVRPTKYPVKHSVLFKFPPERGVLQPFPEKFNPSYSAWNVVQMPYSSNFTVDVWPKQPESEHNSNSDSSEDSTGSRNTAHSSASKKRERTC